MLNLIIDGQNITAQEGETLMQVAQKAGITIPSLCYHEGLESIGACRLCMVEVTKPEWDGWKKTVASCVYLAEEGIIVETENKVLIDYRKEILELLLARCPSSTWLKDFAKKLGVQGTRYELERDKDNCIMCGLCTRACAKMERDAISVAKRGREKEVMPPLGEAPEDCIGCLACAMICPTDNIPYSQQGGKLEIWGKKFDLVKCQECGKEGITMEYSEYLNSKKNVNADTLSTCENCKRHLVKNTFSKIVEWENQ